MSDTVRAEVAEVFFRSWCESVEPFDRIPPLPPVGREDSRLGQALRDASEQAHHYGVAVAGRTAAEATTLVLQLVGVLGLWARCDGASRPHLRAMLHDAMETG
jgi:hypothetical protein